MVLASGVATGIAGCGEGVEIQPDPCADAGVEWWPLEVGAFWDLEIQSATSPTKLRHLEVEALDVPVGGLSASDATAVRLWRDEPEGSGWRWIRRDGAHYLWQRDLWVRDGTREPVSDQFHDPYRLRLDAGRLCRSETWTEQYERITIPLGPEGCASWDGWEGDPTQCDPVMRETIAEEWTVSQVNRTVETPSGTFPGCLCTTRTEAAFGSLESTEYCFAPGIGKVAEYDRDGGQELLADYSIP